MTPTFVYKERGVGEHFCRSEVHDVSRNGATGRENVGMSNRKSDEKSGHRKP